MTPDEWDKANDPQQMLTFLLDTGRLSERKARLFCVAACRRIWPLLRDERLRRAVEVAEQFADELPGGERLAIAAAEARQVTRFEHGPVDECGEWAAIAACHSARHNWFGSKDGYANALCTQRTACLAAASRDARSYTPARQKAGDAEQADQAALVRDIFGNSYDTLPPLLKFHNGDIVNLAQAAYDDRNLPAGTLDNARLAVLADALEESGCDDPELLGHLRQQEQGHVRGCWALDLVLGK
jgi:hypothetical protein